MTRLTPEFATALLGAAVDWTAAPDRHFVLVDPAFVYTPGVTTTVPAGSVVFSSALSGRAVSEGWARADPVLIAGITPGAALGPAAIGVAAGGGDFTLNVWFDELVGLPAYFASDFWVAWQDGGVFRL